jgi:16S rRNA (cytosine1402-N4)-methyltransferase
MFPLLRNPSPHVSLRRLINVPQDLNAPHTPVLLDAVLQALQPVPGRVYVDATLGAGGHAKAILERIAGGHAEAVLEKITDGDTEIDPKKTAGETTGLSPERAKPEGRLIGIDQDPAAIAIARERLARFEDRLQIIRGNFSEIANLLPPEAKPVTGGILADIGVSSMQLDTGERGFSFSKAAPLDMRMSPDAELTAANVVNTYPEADLVRIFSEYGEEHLSKTLAREMVQRRKSAPFQTTTDLATFIADCYKSRGKHEKIHPATRVFQALRIEVNDELGSLQRFLESLPVLLAPGARVAVISFHSLEDRIVKQFFQTESRDCICPPRLPICQCGHKAAFKLLSGKPVTATPEEIRRNPRSRSAKLRAAIRL